MSYGMNRGPTGKNPGASPTGKAPSGYKAFQMQNFTPEQMKLFNQLFSNVGPDSFLSKIAGGDEEAFNQMEAPAWRDFSGVQGNIASRFSGMGTGGRKSSGFQNTMTAAGSNFAQDLQSKRTDLKRQALLDLMGISNQLLNQKPYENFLVPKQKKEGFDWGGAIGAGIGGLGGFAIGGPAGGLTGASLGYNVGSGGI